MLFVNPIEILALEHADVLSIDNAVIKKGKRKMQTEIELSEDGVFHYKGFSLTKADCERVIDELEDADKKEFYHFIATHKLLNDFLSSGDERFFESFSHQSIYQVEEFRNFVGPFFCPQFDKSLQKAFKSNNVRKFKQILTTQALVKKVDFDSAFRGVSQEIQFRLEKVDDLTNDINNQQFPHDQWNISEVVMTMLNDFPTELINALPAFYFQSQLNKIGSAINYLQLAVDAQFHETKVSLDLIEHALQLNIESASHPVFLNNRVILKRRYEEELELQEHADELTSWLVIVKRIYDYREKVEKNQLRGSAVVQQACSLFDTDQLNALGHFADELRNQMAAAYRTVSVSVWNTQNDIENAIFLIRKAAAIRVDEKMKKELNEALQKLYELREQMIAHEKEEMLNLIKLIDNINSQIQLHGMVNIKADKVKGMLDSTFSAELIQTLSTSNELELKKNIYDRLEKILVKLDAFYTNGFLKKIKPLGNNDGALAVRIEKGISGFEFKARNVANNVGTGLGKANDTMVRNLPARLVGIIYLVIIVFIIAAIGALFQGC